MTSSSSAGSRSESGNVIFFVLLAIVLIGLVTVALRSGGEGANIDAETVLIQATQVRQYASDLERGVAFIMREGASESWIRFSHPDADAAYGAVLYVSTAIFDERGGGVEYRLPSPDITSSSWEFYGNTRLPDVGTSNPELIAVLPNVSKAFCDKINEMNGQTEQPKENGDCGINDTAMRFSGTFQDGAENTVDETSTSFSVKPAMQGCIECASTPSTYHFFHVLMAR